MVAELSHPAVIPSSTVNGVAPRMLPPCSSTATTMFSHRTPWSSERRGGLLPGGRGISLNYGPQCHSLRDCHVRISRRRGQSYARRFVAHKNGDLGSVRIGLEDSLP